jgi:hypothetical protein
MPDGRPPRVDREAAFQYWAALPHDTRSYRAVADRFGVSPRTIERYARDGNWRDRLKRIRAAASDQADERLGRNLAKQLADFSQLIEASCVTYARQLASGDVRISAAEFVGLIKATLLLQGAPTARIETVTDSEEWTALRTRILAALADHPDAKLALVEALDDLAEVVE